MARQWCLCVTTTTNSYIWLAAEVQPSTVTQKEALTVHLGAPTYYSVTTKSQVTCKSKSPGLLQRSEPCPYRVTQLSYG